MIGQSETPSKLLYNTLQNAVVVKLNACKRAQWTPPHKLQAAGKQGIQCECNNMMNVTTALAAVASRMGMHRRASCCQGGNTALYAADAMLPQQKVGSLAEAEQENGQ